MAFNPRHQDKKRDAVIPSVRVTSEERVAMEWIMDRLSDRDGASYAIADTVRVAMGVLLEQEVRRARAEGSEVPEVVRRLAGE